MEHRLSFVEELLDGAGASKLRGGAIEVGVHGCHRSQSHDSGLVADFDCDPKPVRKGHCRSQSSDYHGERTAAAPKNSKNLSACRSYSNSLMEDRGSLHLHMSKGGSASAEILQDYPPHCDHAHSGSTILEELNQSQLSIQSDDGYHGDCNNCNNNTSGSDDQHSLCTAQCSHSLHERPEHELIDKTSKHSVTFASTPRKFKPTDCAALTQQRSRHSSGASDVAVDRKRAASPKQSWLLRLFESKMFNMSIAISYLYNSKEPGVQTYIGGFGFISIANNSNLCTCKIYISHVLFIDYDQICLT